MSPPPRSSPATLCWVQASTSGSTRFVRGDLATITLEPRVNIQDGTIVHTDTDAPMTIGEGVVVGHGAILHGTLIGATRWSAWGPSCCRAARSARNA